MEQQEAMNEQRDILFSNLVSPDILRPCVVNDGILSLGTEERLQFVKFFQESNQPYSFFIPASGIGSRMFEFIHRFKQSVNDTDPEDFFRFIANLEKFAFYSSVDETWKTMDYSLRSNALAFCEYLLLPEGLNFRDIPKALFPFHLEDSKQKTPIESHVSQAKKFLNRPKGIHFTIQQNHQDSIQKKLRALTEDTSFPLDCSVQSATSDAYLFDEFKQPVLDGQGTPIRKPSGHGALIDNLSKMKSDVIFVKNIDNIQCGTMDEEVNHHWEMLGGVLLYIVKSLQEAIDKKDVCKIIELNDRFGFTSEIDQDVNIETALKLLNRPFRVCGMVRNEGMPGGGPFWVKHKKVISKQIIEKSQISQAHMSKLTASTHFNPVMMALYKNDLLGGQPHSLNDFIRTDLSMAVSKRHQEKMVYHIEKPGLWNGTMYGWNTVFIEIPSNIFSPVKSVLDLLSSPHQCISTQ